VCERESETHAHARWFCTSGFFFKWNVTFRLWCVYETWCPGSEWKVLIYNWRQKTPWRRILSCLVNEPLTRLAVMAWCCTVVPYDRTDWQQHDAPDVSSGRGVSPVRSCERLSGGQRASLPRLRQTMCPDELHGGPTARIPVRSTSIHGTHRYYTNLFVLGNTSLLTYLSVLQTANLNSKYVILFS